ncbi:hypothetical protein BC831DRAFT_468797 [Entophlyctis helioformis]|nr:hypothetical protein BC831DRAFT_468797 [Entophlyctis helioformis]
MGQQHSRHLKAQPPLQTHPSEHKLAASELESLATPVFLGDQRHTTTRPVTLHLRKNSPVGKPLDCVTVYDLEDTPLYTVKRTPFSFPHMQYAVYDGDRCEQATMLCTIISRFSLISTQLKCSFVNQTDGTTITLYLTMSAADKRGCIYAGKHTYGGVPIGFIGRSPRTSKYDLTIVPGADAALMIVLCIVLDRERSRKSSFLRC